MKNSLTSKLILSSAISLCLAIVLVNGVTHKSYIDNTFAIVFAFMSGLLVGCLTLELLTGKDTK